MEPARKSQGQYWAAVSGDCVIGLTLMPWIPREDDRFNTYRAQARESLSRLGEVISGEIREIDGVRVFVRRQPHANRPRASAEPRPLRLYRLPPALR